LDSHGGLRPPMELLSGYSLHSPSEVDWSDL
jgi:hypothetical protein